MIFFEMLATSLIATHLSYSLMHEKKMGSVRAASLSTLLFALLCQFIGSPLLSSLQATFYGGSFVAMSEPSRLSERRVLLASAVFAALFYALRTHDFLHFHGGVGGTIGASAFVACVLVYCLQGMQALIFKKSQ